MTKIGRYPVFDEASNFQVEKNQIQQPEAKNEEAKFWEHFREPQLIPLKSLMGPISPLKGDPTGLVE